MQEQRPKTGKGVFKSMPVTYEKQDVNALKSTSTL